MKSEDIIAIQKEHPDWTLQHIGDAVGLTKERVRQVLAKRGIRLSVDRIRPPSQYICPSCGGWKSYLPAQCRACSKKPLVELTCEECGAMFTKAPYSITKYSPGRFCSNQCQGKWLGRTSGRKWAEKLRDEIDDLQAKMHRIVTWIDAYPLKIFPEPDFEKARAVLKQNGMTLDAISASSMRHVLTGLKRIIEEVDDAEN